MGGSLCLSSTMPRLTVTLRPDEYDALQRLAWAERRPTRDQLAWLVVTGLAAAMANRPRQEDPDPVLVPAGAPDGALAKGNPQPQCLAGQAEGPLGVSNVPVSGYTPDVHIIA
jgi:hypothetical protein